tara:strand:- start:229 stop:2109 length:1881 start_codon:yes stop_codon:yes gene_type:complete
MAVEGGGLFNPGYLGQGFNWWIGQVADDSYWRENINPGKFEDKDSILGWGYRYKVRIFGLHDWGEDSIPSENLPWANVMYPVTAGGYQQNSGQTPMVRQGNIVFGFFLDGSEQEQPVIMGVLGNNSQTQLATKIGDNRVSNTQPGSVATSGYAEGNVDYKGTTSPTPPDNDKVVNKPTDPETAKEIAADPPNTKLNEYGLSRNPTPVQQKDIQSAKREIQLILERNPGFSLFAQQELIRKRVARGKNSRRKEAQSPRSPVHPGATIESEAAHIQSAADIKLDEVFCKKRVTLKPTNIVESCNKAIQTDMDNMTTSIDKAMNALASYTDAVSITQGVKDLKKVISDSSKTQSKYMKVIMDKVMEYSQKKVNKEMTGAVSALPACKRWQMLDLKDIMTQDILSEFNNMTGSMSGLMEGVLSNMLKLEDGVDKEGIPYKGLINKALDFVTDSNDSDNKEKAMPKVPMCVAEDAVSAVVHSNMPKIEDTTSKLLDGIDTFMSDMMSELSGAGGTDITNLFSKLGNIKGNMTSALDFENIKQNVFPFELPPNEAVADYYQFCSGGASQSQAQIPSNPSIMDAVTKLTDRIVPNPLPIEVFAEPLKNSPNINLTENPILRGQRGDDGEVEIV